MSTDTPMRANVTIGSSIFDIERRAELHGEREHMIWSSPQFPEVYVKGIAATINRSTGTLLLTLECRFHRWVLAEFNTHRVFSRNSASSRAIPVARRLEDVQTSPAEPIVWASEQKGMQGGNELGESARMAAERLWRNAAADAARSAEALAELGVHKSIVNRLLEPFLYHTAIVTSTEWSGFIQQRSSRQAQPEIHLLGALVAEAYEYYREVPSAAAPANPGMWHMPYIDFETDSALLLKYLSLVSVSVLQSLARVSAARCARVSYETHDGVRDISKDLELYDKLVGAAPMHASPLEHVAMAVTHEQINAWPGNLTGFAQLRHFVEAGINPFGGR